MILVQKISLLENKPRLRGLAKWAALANILGVFITVLAWRLPTSSTPTQRGPAGGPHTTEGLRIAEISQAGASDGIVELRGRTTFAEEKHYVIVQPPRGAPVIQDEPMRVSPHGEIAGRAVLGSKAVGAGEEFTIQVFATGLALPPGSQSVPPDAKFSDPVTVKRKPKGA